MLILIFIIITLVFSAILHEYAHGWVAYKLGDDTAKNAGRLTLNPIAHLDLFGSILFPLLLILSKAGFLLAWAKPVPYNPYNLRDPKYGELKVALGGPATNFIIAILFGLIARVMPISLAIKQDLIGNYFMGNYDLLLGQMHGSMVISIFVLSFIIVFINLLLMVFNLIPLPPLDGSKILTTFLSYEGKLAFHRIEPYGFFIIIFLVMFGFFSIIWRPLIYLFGLLVGMPI